jgi:hypothetical protein
MAGSLNQGNYTDCETSARLRQIMIPRGDRRGSMKTDRMQPTALQIDNEMLANTAAET